MGVAEATKGNGRMKREKQSKRKGGGGPAKKENEILSYSKRLSGFKKHLLGLPVVPSRQSGTTCLTSAGTFLLFLFYQFHLTLYNRYNSPTPDRKEEINMKLFSITTHVLYR